MSDGARSKAEKVLLDAGVPDRAAELFLDRFIKGTLPRLQACGEPGQVRREGRRRQAAARALETAARKAGDAFGRRPAADLLERARVIQKTGKTRTKLRHFLADEKQIHRTLELNAFAWHLRDFVEDRTTLRGSKARDVVGSFLRSFDLIGPGENDAIRRRFERSREFRDPLWRLVQTDAGRRYIVWLEAEVARLLVELDGGKPNSSSPTVH